MADFEAGSIFIAFRSATDQLRRGFRQARSLFARMGGAANALRRVMERAAARVGRAWARVGRTLGRVALAMKIALGIATVASIKWASEGVEATNKMNEVFGEHAGIVEEFAKTSARSFGIARADAKAYAATLGQILQVADFTEKASAELSVGILKLAADMASFNDETIEDTLLAIRAGLVGEVEPLRRRGILLSENEVAQKALTLGLVKTRGELNQQIRVQGRYALLLEQSAKQQGDFTRTSDEFANSLRIVRAQLKEVFEMLGTFLLPILTKGLNKTKEILDTIPVLIESIAGISQIFREAAGGEDLASRLQRIFNAVTDFVIDLFGGINKFLRTNFTEITKTVSKIVAGIAGPSAKKVMKLIFANVKSGLTQIVNLFALPFNVAIALVTNLGAHIVDELTAALEKFLRVAVEKLEGNRIAEKIFGKENIAGLKAILGVMDEMETKTKKLGRSVQTVIDEAIAVSADFALNIDENLRLERLKIEAEIDKLAAELRDSGALGQAMEEAETLLRKAGTAASDTFDKALRSAIEAMGLNADKIIEKLRLARARLALISPGATPGDPAVPTGAAKPGLDPDVVKEIEELGKQTRAAIASSVAGGIADGVLEGKRAIEILADIGRRLFRNAFNAAVVSFQKALDTAIEQSSIKAQALLSGVLNAAVAIVGLLLSQLDRGSDSSRRFGRLGAEVESSQLVRGVIAGPTNVAIAEVGENLKRALATTEEILRQSLFVQTEMRDRMGSRGNGINATPTAGITPTVAP